MAKIIVEGTEISVIQSNNEDYISLTDMIKAKDGDFFVADWLRNRNTLEYIGIWEKFYNPAFNYGEFAIIKSQSGLNSFKISVKEFVSKTNIRDYATINELICLSNMENINAVLINDGIPQGERLVRLNQIAIQQMRILNDNDGRKLLK